MLRHLTSTGRAVMPTCWHADRHAFLVDPFGGCSFLCRLCRYRITRVQLKYFPQAEDLVGSVMNGSVSIEEGKHAMRVTA
jgi:hypothetical protein